MGEANSRGALWSAMATTGLEDGRVERFESTLRGELVRPEDAEYDDARVVWNGVIDRSPALVVRCAGVADVQRAVGFARETELPLSVRGGGHNVAGTAVCDDGLVVDCSAMTAVRVDPVARTAWVESGATWADVDHETQAFGLATPGASSPTPGSPG